jgi:putative transposase
VTRHPTDAWVAQQLREATPFGAGPRFLIRDNDKKYGDQFQHVVDGADIDLLKTPVEAPRANAFCERFLGSLRRECLDYMLILSERHLRRIVSEYITYFNQARPVLAEMHIRSEFPPETRWSTMTPLFQPIG